VEKRLTTEHNCRSKNRKDGNDSDSVARTIAWDGRWDYLLGETEGMKSKVQSAKSNVRNER